MLESMTHLASSNEVFVFAREERYDGRIDHRDVSVLSPHDGQEVVPACIIWLFQKGTHSASESLGVLSS